jgi:hypothetical protein
MISPPARLYFRRYQPSMAVMAWLVVPLVPLVPLVRVANRPPAEIAKFGQKTGHKQ